MEKSANFDTIQSRSKDSSELNDSDLESGSSDSELEDYNPDKINSEETWIERDMTPIPAQCLFCDEIHSDLNKMIYEHFKDHGFDFNKLKIKHSMDQISYIKMINYLKQERSKAVGDDKFEEFEQFVTTINDLQQIPWLDMQYMTPYEDDDPLLCILIENEENEEEMKSETDEVEVNSTDNNFEEEVREASKILASNRMDLIRRVFGRIVSDKKPTCSKTKLNRSPNHEENLYFESYDELGIHAEMLSDRARMSAYHNAIVGNSSYFEGKTVLDLGCGTGILSMFCVKAGAAKVIAVDKSNIIYEAMEIAEENDMLKKITFFHGSIEELRLEEPVDIIVSEFMGYFLLFEGMISSFFYARDNHLKPNGFLFPSGAQIQLFGCSDEKLYKEDIQMWDDIYGFKMTVMKKKALSEAKIDTIKSEHIITPPVNVLDLNLNTCDMKDTIFKKDFTLFIEKTSTLVAIVGSFNVIFPAEKDQFFILDTSPDSEPTHWEQTVFFLPEKIPVNKNDEFHCTIECRPSDANPRELYVIIKINDMVCHYNIR